MEEANEAIKYNDTNFNKLEFQKISKEISNLLNKDINLDETFEKPKESNCLYTLLGCGY